MATIRFTTGSTGYSLAPRKTPASEAQGEEAGPGDVPGQPPIDRWWRESSFDLKHGLEVHEEPADTVPGDLLDELFKH